MDKLLEFVALLCPNLEENTGSLQRKIKLLEGRKDDIDEELQNAACHSGKKRKREVEDWRNNVENIIKGFGALEQEVQQSSRFYHVFKRQKLADQLERMTEDVKELVAQSEFPKGLFLEVGESIDQLLLIPQPNGQTFQQNLDDIWTSLMDVNIVSIGIYGMGGVGKTTLARHVHDKLKESTFSDHVYWVTVSQEFSIDELQTDIARALNLQFSCEKDAGKRAAQLFQAFKKKERPVLILDDVWKRIDAEKIGIPSKRDGCKLVITSRLEEVCRSMCCKKIIKVNTLSYQEALDLFFKTLDRDELSVEVKEICKKMVIRCHGLPLALITLAGSMRGVIDIHGWRDALEGLEQSCLGPADMKDDVLPVLLYSYHQLRDTWLKRCFLHCSLYPEDYRISRYEVIKDFISEELMEIRSSWQAEVDQGHAILNQLVRACLLEISDSYGVKMHDLIREMAIRITADKPRYMVKAGIHLKELPEEQKWTEDLDKVSLMCNSIEEISHGTSPKCPSLSTLILRRNPLRLIPDCFFTHMRGLRTLDLSDTSIACLPNSISDLEKLNALLLKGCSRLQSVPSLEKLKVLRYLDLSFTSIEEVPQGMESLTNLKRLSLVCYRLRMIPTGTLHRLTHLQQLELPNHLDVPYEEVEALKQLEEFRGRLNSVRDLNRLINSRQIDKPFHFYNNRLHFEEDSLMESSLDTDENMLPRGFETLFFSRSGLSGCLLDEFPILNSARDLKVCRIGEEDKIECIMRLEEEQQSSGVPFQSLETLSLDCMPNLIGLFKWEAVAAPLPHGTFSCLKELRINGCGKIKKLFPQSAVHNFHNLQDLSILDCVQMEEIIEDDNNEGVDITLPRLKCFSSLRTLWIGGCGNIKKLFRWSSLHNFCKLQHLTVRDCVQMEEIIEDDNNEGSDITLSRLKCFSCLQTLWINGCGNMKKLFPQSLVHNFCNLQSLSILACFQMEEIIEDDNNEGTDITLPMLKTLFLYYLPRVKSICKGKMICDSIENISFWGFINIKEFPLYLPLLDGQLSPPPRLAAIEINGDKEWWESLEWPHHNAKNVLQPLVKYK